MCDRERENTGVTERECGCLTERERVYERESVCERVRERGCQECESRIETNERRDRTRFSTSLY